LASEIVGRFMMPVKKDKDVYVLLGEEDRPLPSVRDLERARSAPSQGAIARRAFERFVARGASHGRDVEDWLAAERELRGR
jgi:hypothetical protein